MKQLIPVRDLREGDIVDLEGDIYADPKRNKPCLECEYAEVLEIEQETPACVLVYFDKITVGFPTMHRVWRAGNADR